MHVGDPTVQVGAGAGLPALVAELPAFQIQFVVAELKSRVCQRRSIAASTCVTACAWAVGAAVARCCPAVPRGPVRPVTV